jgi:hypothetical protein
MHIEKYALFLAKWGLNILYLARMANKWGNISLKTEFANSIEAAGEPIM